VRSHFRTGFMNLIDPPHNGRSSYRSIRPQPSCIDLEIDAPRTRARETSIASPEEYEFGPLLVTSIKDSSQSYAKWLHWEALKTKQKATFKCSRLQVFSKETGETGSGHSSTNRNDSLIQVGKQAGRATVACPQSSRSGCFLDTSLS
jgi:hypothetical protein